MRVLSIGNGFLVAPLRALGHEVHEAFPDHPDLCMPGVPFDVTAVVERLPGPPDVVLVADLLGPQAMPAGLEHVPAPRIYWAIDVHVNHFWQRHFARCFDLVLVAQRDWVPLVEAEGVPAVWFPWAADGTVFRDAGLPRVHDVAFVGCLDPVRRPKRSALLSLLARHFACAVFGADATRRLSWVEMARVYQQARIVVNESIFGDLTFRVFEAMGCGAMVLSERTANGLTTLFRPGEHLDVFDADDVLERVGWWLAHEAERARAAAAGAALVAAHHDVRHRAAAFVALVEAGIARRDTRRQGARDWALAAHLASVRGVLHAGRTLAMLAPPLQTAIARDGDGEAALVLAESVAASGRSDDARHLLGHASALAPGDPRPALLAAELARRAGDPAWALRVLRAAVAEAAVDDGVRARATAALAGGVETAACAEALGALLAARGHAITPGFIPLQGLDVPRSAFDWYLRAAELGSVSAGVQAARMLQWVGLGDVAVLVLEHAVGRAPADRTVREALAEALHASYQPDEAAHHRRVLAVLAGAPPPDGPPAARARALHDAGVALAQSGALPAALEALDAAAALVPDDNVSTAEAALVCIASGDWPAARRRLEHVLAAAPDAPGPLAELLLLVRGRQADATAA